MYKSILDAIVDMAKEQATMKVVVGSNPPKESIAITGFASADATLRDKDTLQTYDITINGKSGDQEQVLADLSKIHKSLTLRRDFPHSELWQIYSIETTASPRLLGVEEAERTRYLYGSSIVVKFYALGLKGEQA
jgi:hypothetical protein